MTNILLVATGGALGASLRYFIINIARYLYPNLPLGTLFVNILGSFLIGFLMNYLENKNVSDVFIRYFIIIGILGSFTTFSTFSFDVIELLNNKKIFISLSYILISVSTCLFFTYIGYNFNKI